MNRMFFILIAAAFTACSNEPEKSLVYSNDAEQALGWINQNTLKASNEAHSGGWISCIDSTFAYSLTFREKLSEVREIEANTINAKAWVRLISPAAKGGLVISVDDNGKNLLWQMLPLESVITKPGEWEIVKYKVALPADAPSTAVVSTYFWNQGKEEIHIDDMEVEFTRR